MREVVSTVSSKGQVTIPAEIRKLMGLRQGDRLSFVIDDEGVIYLQTPRYRNVASLRGAAGKLGKPLDWGEMRAIAREDQAAEAMSEG